MIFLISRERFSILFFAPKDQGMLQYQYTQNDDIAVKGTLPLFRVRSWLRHILGEEENSSVSCYIPEKELYIERQLTTEEVIQELLRVEKYF